MEIIELLGFLSAFFIGLVLGILGGGGSILTVPVLVYIFSLNPVIASAYSLFVVGVSGLGGVIRNLNRGLINYKVGIIYAIPSFIAVYITRKYLIPELPEILFEFGNQQVSRDLGLMLFFAIIMLYVAITMIKQKKKMTPEPQVKSHSIPILGFQGFTVGILTGIIGAGGGFLIIPALVFFAKLSMKSAVATSLFIIALKSLIGFIGDVENIQIDWSFLLIFTSISVLGLLFGTFLSKFINDKKLKRMFGWFVLFMGIFIIIIELI
jgi:uncharacterized membrane protein YfcA